MEAAPSLTRRVLHGFCPGLVRSCAPRDCPALGGIAPGLRDPDGAAWLQWWAWRTFSAPIWSDQQLSLRPIPEHMLSALSLSPLNHLIFTPLPLSTSSHITSHQAAQPCGGPPDAHPAPNWLAAPAAFVCLCAVPPKQSRVRLSSSFRVRCTKGLGM